MALRDFILTDNPLGKPLGKTRGKPWRASHVASLLASHAYGKPLGNPCDKPSAKSCGEPLGIEYYVLLHWTVSKIFERNTNTNVFFRSVVIA